MERTRILIPIEVDLDPIPGTFHTKESAEACIQAILKESIGHYNPKVITGLPTMPPEAAAEFQRLLEGGPQALLASLGEMLSNPHVAEAMTQVTEEIKANLRVEGEPEVPDHIEPSWTLPACGHLECADHPETCPDLHTSWCEGCDKAEDGRNACIVFDENNPKWGQ